MELPRPLERGFSDSHAYNEDFRLDIITRYAVERRGNYIVDWYVNLSRMNWHYRSYGTSEVRIRL